MANLRLTEVCFARAPARPEGEFLQLMIYLVVGEVVAEAPETAPILPDQSRPGDTPRRGCYCCGERRFHRVKGGPEWVWSTCHPPGARKEVVETCIAAEPSLIELMRRPKDRTELFDLWGLGRGWKSGRHD